MIRLQGDCDQSLVEDYLDQELREAAQILPHFDGGTVRFWEFDPSIFTLTLRLALPSRPGDLKIICTNPISQNGPFEWSGSELRVTRDATSFLVSDAKAGFLLRALVVDVVEDVESKDTFFGPASRRGRGARGALIE